jgi:hypothetical protein
VDRVDRISIDEGHSGQYKRGERIGTTGGRKCSYTTTSSMHINHSHSTTGIGRSGENEGSTKYPAIETETTARRGSVGNWRFGYGAR